MLVGETSAIENGESMDKKTFKNSERLPPVLDR